MKIFRTYLIWASLIAILCLSVYFLKTDRFETKIYSRHIHTTIYIDNNFNNAEKEEIINSALEWSVTTNHIVEYDIVYLQSLENVSLINSLIIIKVTPNYPDIMALDAMTNDTVLGYYSDDSLPYIELVSERLDDENFHQVVMHELGHSLGLSHNEGTSGIGTLMYPYNNLGAAHITPSDGIKFCAIYHCDPSKLQYKKEPFHF